MSLRFQTLLQSLTQSLIITLCLSVMLSTTTGCGFQLRGACPVPVSLRIMRVAPFYSYDPFQRSLRQTLTLMGMKIINEPYPEKPLPLITIINQSFLERTTAFGPDVQVNRALLQFTLTYQIADSTGKLIVPPSSIQVVRELPINPNAVLGTDYERNRVQEELYQDATLQLVRQLSRVNQE